MHSSPTRVSVFHNHLDYFLLNLILFSHFSPSSSLFASVRFTHTLFPHHTSPTMFFSNIYLLFLRINCTVLYSGINSRNTVTVNNLLSVWEKASAAPICRGLESNLPAMSQVVLNEKLFRIKPGLFHQMGGVDRTERSPTQQSVGHYQLTYSHRFSHIIMVLVIWVYQLYNTISII